MIYDRFFICKIVRKPNLKELQQIFIGMLYFTGRREFLEESVARLKKPRVSMWLLFAASQRTNQLRPDAFGFAERWTESRREKRRYREKREEREGGKGGERERKKESEWERKRWRRQRAEARRTRVREMKAEGVWGIARRRTGGEPSAGSTFIHKTKAESDKERIVSGTRTITGSANALPAYQRRRKRGISATHLTRLSLLLTIVQQNFRFLLIELIKIFTDALAISKSSIYNKRIYLRSISLNY